MTAPSASIQALRSLGYTNGESEFLYLVAIHSGYFTHSQYLSFSQIKPGYVSHEFTAKLIRQKHASFHAYRSGGRVYHLFSRKVYNAIGRDNLRTRRRHQLDYIKTRLVTLDFILEHPDYPYLETESEKVPFFAERAESLRRRSPVQTLLLVEVPRSHGPLFCGPVSHLCRLSLLSHCGHLHVCRSRKRNSATFPHASGRICRVASCPEPL